MILLLIVPVVVRQSSVAVNGAGGESPRVQRALRRFKPAVGDPLDHAVYENSKDVVSSTLATEGWLVPGALVVVERSSRSPEPTWPGGFEETRSKRYGERTLWYAESGEASS